MQVTNVVVVKKDDELSKIRGIKGYATITIDNCFVVHDIKIRTKKSDGSTFVAMPNKETKEGTYRDICHPINNKTREMIENAILDKFNSI